MHGLSPMDAKVHGSTTTAAVAVTWTGQSGMIVSEKQERETVALDPLIVFALHRFPFSS